MDHQIQDDSDMGHARIIGPQAFHGDKAGLMDMLDGFKNGGVKALNVPHLKDKVFLLRQSQELSGFIQG
jgi:hypothetical protein